MKHLILLLILSLSTACSCYNKTQMKQENKAFAYQIIAQSSLHGNGAEGIEAGHYIIDNEKDWQQLLKKMNKVNDETVKFSTTDIDFDNEMIVAVFDPVLTSGGIKLIVKQVEVLPDRIKLYVGHQEPTGRFATMVMNQPYLIIKVNKTDKKIEVINEN